MMGQTSAGLTWPVRMCMQFPEMTVMTSPENTRNLTGTYGPGYCPAYYKRDVDQGHHGMTMRHNQSYTAQPERKLRRKCVTEGGGLWKNKTASPSLPI